MDWEITDEPATQDLAILKAAVRADGRSIAGSDAAPLACFFREAGEICGGVVLPAFEDNEWLPYNGRINPYAVCTVIEKNNCQNDQYINVWN